VFTKGFFGISKQRTESQRSHELKHIVSGDADKTPSFETWFQSQANELDADLFALSLLLGTYNPDAV
jgi:Zn-dependent peptidase ImmA (M78 family)